MKLILKYLNEYGSASRKEIIALLEDKLPKSLDNKNKINRVKYLLNTLKKEGKIYNDTKLGGHVGRLNNFHHFFYHFNYFFATFIKNCREIRRDL